MIPMPEFFKLGFEIVLWQTKAGCNRRLRLINQHNLTNMLTGFH